MEEKFYFFVYGLSKDEVERIKKAVKEEFNRESEFISGVGKEEILVKHILDDWEEGSFEDLETKIIMLLNLDDNEIFRFLEIYPKELKRPIFCTPTENNIHWSLKELIEDLVEEHRFFKEQQKNKEKGNN